MTVVAYISGRNRLRRNARVSRRQGADILISHKHRNACTRDKTTERDKRSGIIFCRVISIVRPKSPFCNSAEDPEGRALDFQKLFSHLDKSEPEESGTIAESLRRERGKREEKERDANEWQLARARWMSYICTCVVSD